jgi:hypothetical protein
LELGYRDDKHVGARTMKVTKVSSLTGVTHQREIEATQEQLLRHANGELIQNVFPDLSAEDREYLMTGITQEEWQQLMTCENCDD